MLMLWKYLHRKGIKLQVIELVMKRLGFPTQTALTDFLGVNRSCAWEWKQRLDGGIPSRHHKTLIDEAERQGVKLTVKELHGE